MKAGEDSVYSMVQCTEGDCNGRDYLSLIYLPLSCFVLVTEGLDGATPARTLEADNQRRPSCPGWRESLAPGVSGHQTPGVSPPCLTKSKILRTCGKRNFNGQASNNDQVRKVSGLTLFDPGSSREDPRPPTN